MTTNKSLSLVAKCKCILTMIDRVNSKLQSLNKRLANCEPPALFVYGTRPSLESFIKKNEYILERLTRYYSKTLTQLTDEALEQCFPLSIAS